jgi:hypothetical protein
MQTPDQTVPGFMGVDSVAPVAEPAPTMAGSTKSPLKWGLVAAGAVVAGLVAVAFSLRPPVAVEVAPTAPVAQQMSVSPSVAVPHAPVLQPAASATVAIASAPATAPASRPEVAAMAGASHASSKAKTAAPAVAAPAQAHVPTPQASAPAPVNHGIGTGPSRPGQVCANEVFIFKIKCIADQCTTDRYRNTPECIRFKELEREREEQRNSRR